MVQCPEPARSDSRPRPGRRRASGGAPIEIHAGPDLTLRLLASDDVPALFALIDGGRARLRRWLSFVDATRAPSDSAAFVRAAAAQAATGTGRHFGIRWRGTLVGVIGYRRPDPFPTLQIGYWLGEGFEGRGLMTAACRALVAHAFAAAGAHRVEIRAATANRRSRAIPERLAFRLEGVLREAERLPELGWVDHCVYGMTAGEWSRLRGLRPGAPSGPAAPGGGESPSAAVARPEPAGTPASGAARAPAAAGPGPGPEVPAPGSAPRAIPAPAAPGGSRAAPAGGGLRAARAPAEAIAATAAAAAPDSPALDAEMAAYYQARAPEYDDWYERRGRYADPETDAAWFAELAVLHGVAARFAAALPARSAVLDAGCGTGRWTAALAERADLAVCGLDQAPAMLAQAQARLARLGLRAVLVRGDALDLPFAAAAFDAALSAFVFDHLGAGGRAAFLGELCRAVRPGGRVLLLDSRREARHAGEVEIQQRVLADGRRFRVRKTLFTADTLREALAPLGPAAVGETPNFFVWAEVAVPNP